MSIDPSKLALVSGTRVGPAAFRIIDGLQCQYTPEEQLAGAAVTFLLVCKKLNAHPGNVLPVAGNILDNLRHQFPEIAAVRDYIDKEIKI